ncbi:hypothetical protein TNCV_4995201 [Trichonephila clavipes]|nr:hypothetical protein TNCV_4995201 [Trichonephila clavipes]
MESSNLRLPQLAQQPSSLLAYNALLNFPIYFAYPVRFSELIGNIREFIIPQKTPKNISGKAPFRFVTTLFVLDTLLETQWQSGCVSRFHATDPGFKIRAGQRRLSLSSLQ